MERVEVGADGAELGPDVAMRRDGGAGIVRYIDSSPSESRSRSKAIDIHELYGSVSPIKDHLLHLVGVGGIRLSVSDK